MRMTELPWRYRSWGNALPYLVASFVPSILFFDAVGWALGIPWAHLAIGFIAMLSLLLPGCRELPHNKPLNRTVNTGESN